MPGHDLVARVDLSIEHGVKPRTLDVPGTTQAREARVHDDEQKITPAYPVAQALLTRGPVAREIREHLAPHRLRLQVVRVVVARDVVDRDPIRIQPGHFLRQPVLPLSPEAIGIAGCPINVVTEKDDEVGRRIQPLKSGIYPGEGALVMGPWNAARTPFGS